MAILSSEVHFDIKWTLLEKLKVSTTCRKCISTVYSLHVAIKITCLKEGLVQCGLVYMLWFDFILGSNFIFLCFKLIIIHYHTPKQRKMKFEPRIKLNHNIYSIVLVIFLHLKERKGNGAIVK